MPLEEFLRKRDFSQTPEPAEKPAATHLLPIFVIQEHHARRLHYDFRLEADGVLKSWAVPKEPSMDPAVKRLAVHVEDHPVSYAQFEGTIPAGSYGAGTVAIWDHGTYAVEPAGKSVTDAIAAGRLEFTLHRQKLKGRFALLRMKKERGKDNWLLIKLKDAHAKLERHRDSPSEDVMFTHLGKVLYPDARITKGEVIDYYRRIAPRLLPYLRNRPITLERLPDGLGEGKPHFWQKHTPVSYPPWIPRATLPGTDGKTVSYVLVNDEKTLLYLVNQGTLTFHAWLSRLDDLDRPDFVLFDLDMGEANFADVVAVARELRRVLQEVDEPAFIKTSGKTGLHVLVPWQVEGGYDEARAWALSTAQRVAAALPDRATVEVRKAARSGRVYLDVLQNARGHHVVPPYVLRAVPGAPVSTPLNWRELTPDLKPKLFNLKTIFRRLSRLKHDPLDGLLLAAVEV